MWTLLRAELAALANGWRHPEGRQAARSAAIAFLCTAVGAAVASRNVLTTEPVLALLERDPDGRLLRALVGLWMAPALALTFSLAMSQLGGRLVRTTAPELALSSPVSPGAWLAVVTTRLGLTLAAWALVLVVPGLAGLSVERGLSPAALLATPVAVLIVVGPALTAALAAHVVLMRFVASPRIKAALHGLGGLAMLAFALAAALGFVGHDEHAERLAAWLAAGAELPAVLDLPARWSLWLTGAPAGAPAALPSLLLVVAPWVAVLVLAPLYRRAYENALVTADPVLAALPRALGRRWPAGVAGSVFRRECVRLLQQPSQLLGWLFAAAVVLLFESILGAPREDAAAATPPWIAATFPQLVAWLVVLMLLGALALPAVAVEQRPQRELLMGSPASRGALLLGLVLANGLPYLWCLLVLVVAALTMGDIPVAALGPLLALGTPLALAVLLLATALGLSVARAPTGPDGQLAVTHLLLVELALLAVLALFFSVVLEARGSLEAAYLGRDADAWSGPTTGLVAAGGFLGLCAVVSLLSLLLARRGLERWLSPD